MNIIDWWPCLPYHYIFCWKYSFWLLWHINVCKLSQVRNLFRSGRTLQFYLAMNDNVNYGYGQCDNYEWNKKYNLCLSCFSHFGIGSMIGPNYNISTVHCVDFYKVKWREASAQFSTIKVKEYSRTCIMDCLFFYNLR